MLEAELRGNSSLFLSHERAASSPFKAAVKGLSSDCFYVELKPHETTVVSWKKPLKDSQMSSLPIASMAPADVHPALEAPIAPEIGNITLHVDLFPSPQRPFNSVIQKIEGLYKGENSSDEDNHLNDVPDVDKYDTNNSFIDDAELDDYFSVDTSHSKHTGCFINKGTLETWVGPSVSHASIPKKRNKNDTMKLSNQTAPEDHSNRILKSSSRLKAAAIKVPLTMVHSSGSNSTFTSLTSISQKKDQRDIIIGEESKSQVPGSIYGKMLGDMPCESNDKYVNSCIGISQSRKNDHQKSLGSYEVAEKLLTTPDRLFSVMAGNILHGQKMNPCVHINKDTAPLVESQMMDKSKDISVIKSKMYTKSKVDEMGMTVRNGISPFQCKEEPRSKQQTAGNLIEEKHNGESISSVLSYSIPGPGDSSQTSNSGDHVARSESGKFLESPANESNNDRRKCFKESGRKRQNDLSGSAARSANKRDLKNRSHMSEEGSLRSSTVVPSKRNCLAGTSHMSNQGALGILATAPENRSYLTNKSQMSYDSLRISVAAPAKRSHLANASRMTDGSPQISAESPAKRSYSANGSHRCDGSFRTSPAAPARSYLINESQMRKERSLRISAFSPAKRSYSSHLKLAT